MASDSFQADRGSPIAYESRLFVNNKNARANTQLKREAGPHCQPGKCDSPNLRKCKDPHSLGGGCFLKCTFLNPMPENSSLEDLACGLKICIFSRNSE